MKYKISDIAKIVNGSTPSTSDASNYDGDIVWITPKDLSEQKSKYIESGNRNITPKGFASCSTQMIPAYNLLMSSRAPIGLFAINTVDCCTNQGFKNMILDKEKVDVDFMYYFLKFHVREIEALGSGTTFKEVSKSALEKYEIDIPSLDEQRKIAKVLSDLDEKIALNRAMNEELEQTARDLYDYWFLQFDFPDANGKPYRSSGGKMVYNDTLKREIPEGWEVKSVGDLLNKVKNTYKVPTKEYLKDGKYPIIDQATDTYFAGWSNTDDAVVTQHPIVVFGDHSCAVKYVDIDFCRGADGTQLICSNDVPTEYLYFAILNTHISSGYARHFSFLKNTPIIIPNSKYLKLYQTQTRRFFKTITSNRMENNNLLKLRDELLPLLMNGQVEVKD